MSLLIIFFKATVMLNIHTVLVKKQKLNMTGFSTSNICKNQTQTKLFPILLNTTAQFTKKTEGKSHPMKKAMLLQTKTENCGLQSNY